MGRARDRAVIVVHKAGVLVSELVRLLKFVARGRPVVAKEAICLNQLLLQLLLPLLRSQRLVFVGRGLLNLQIRCEF